jgi:phosphoenolpyruvate carboxykinase (ATP)
VLNLEQMGIINVERTYYNLPTPALVERAIRNHEGHLAHLGPLVTRTGQYTGRSANDKFVVEEPSSRDKIWWGKHNTGMDERRFEHLEARLLAYLQGRDIYVQDAYAGADPDCRLRVRVITETAWHSMFVRNMFIRELDRDVLKGFEPEFVVLHCPGFRAIPELDGTNSEAFIVLHLGRRLVIIGGTSYAGEIKKSIFTVMNYLLPQRGVLGMHCSANRGADGDTALFFGLSGTGKTTLSSEADRAMIGDDEHGWNESGIFNFEGGCYAKVIRLDPEAEPEIYATTRRFGTILENVALSMTDRRIDLDDASLAENTRASYPITHLPNIVADGRGPHPRHIIMLTADAFGVLPPIGRMTPSQAMYHFISGYTAKVAGTERGVTEPVATFSACFGAPFMALPPTVYADMLGKRIAEHGSQCWLVNTGWTGGPHGTGHRMKIQHTRAMVRSALSGQLDEVEFRTDPVFKVAVPCEVPGVPGEVLTPRSTWSDPDAYDAKADTLAELFARNFEEYADSLGDEVKASAPGRAG